jgi:hypothetical protein
MPRFRIVVGAFIVLIGLGLLLYAAVGWATEMIDFTRVAYTFIPAIFCIVIGVCMMPSLCMGCAARESSADPPLAVPTKSNLIRGPWPQESRPYRTDN